MKRSLLFLTLTVYCTTFAQTKETYYDFFWKESKPENASYYSIRTKTDSGWLQTDYYLSTKTLQMSALYSDESCKIQNGHARYYYPNGVPSVVGTMVNNKQEGVCISYHSNGMMSDSALFENGKVVDKRFRWYSNGMMSDSICRINDSTYVRVGWFEDGKIASAGYVVNGEQYGKWQYFHHNGRVSAVETYANGQLQHALYTDEQGNEVQDTSMVNRRATVRGGLAAWSKYLQRSLYWPKGLAFSTPASVTVGVRFWVGHDGQIENAEVYMPFHEAFDKIALQIINNGPRWMPEISHNRTVRVEHRQPITFAQPE